jgi:hypothetical protein
MNSHHNPYEKMFSLAAKALIFLSLFSRPVVTQKAIKITDEIFKELKENRT